TDSTTFTGSYTITQDDIDAGSFFNTATADSDESEEASNNETVPLEQAPSYTITKTVTDVDGGGPMGVVDMAGDVISYHVAVVNTGNQTITAVTLDDSLVAMVGMATETDGTGVSGDGNLDVDETWTWTYTYTVTQADIVNNGGGDGDIDNTATVGSDQLPEMSDSEEVPIVTLGDVTGLKFWDRNANGVREIAGADGYLGTPDDEVGLGGWEIVLFADFNGNRLLDQFELDARPVAVDITSASGFYAFPQIPSGDYIIVEVVQLGWLQSFPLGSSVLAPGLDTRGVPLGAKGHAGRAFGGQLNPGNDFGNFRIGKHLTLVSAEDRADREFDLTKGDVWFPIEPGTAQELMAHVSYASGIVQLDLYDHNLELVAGGEAAGGSQSLSWKQHESEIWYLRLYGTSPSAFLSIYESIRRDGDTVHVKGTPHADDIDFRATGTEYLVSVNGRQYAFNATDISKFVVEGGAGDDAISLTGTPDNELARLYPGWGKLEGPGYEVTFHEFSSIAVDGAGGSDRVLMYDSTGNDRFYAHPNSARMIGDGFVNNVTGFERVYAYAKYGGELDRAYLYDSAEDDILVAKPEYAILRAANSAYYNMAHGFDRVFAYAKAGGTLDRAYLFDSAANDVFVGRPEFAQMRDEGSTYFNRATNFDRVFAYAKAGGTLDRAYFYDSAANDVFLGRPEFAQMRDDGTTYFNRATNFDRVYAYATVGGSNDRAFLYDSAEDDIFVGKHDFGLMRRADNQYYNLARYFDRVYAFATTGYDRAKLYGTAGSETLTFAPAYTSFRGADFFHRASGFDDTRAYGGGGFDTAYFKDVAAADHLYGRNNYARLYRGPQKYWAYDFEVVKAYAKDGETATADVDANTVDYLFQQFGSWL
ncbi:MAG: hypothetical protein OES79_13310, partial [Planctomycetota bacterium]|nr:hypothetical protein [Planctomycetota bacterium]